MYRPPVGIPRREQKRWQGWILSLLAHLLLLLAILLPARDSGIDYGHRDGAGGPGPAGGGGGGFGDNGAPRVHFVQITPTVSAAPIPTRSVVVPPTPVPPQHSPAAESQLQRRSEEHEPHSGEENCLVSAHQARRWPVQPTAAHCLPQTCQSGPWAQGAACAATLATAWPARPS